MKTPTPVHLLAAALLLAAAGCTSTSEVVSEDLVPVDSIFVQPQRAWVFIDGEQRGTTPMTVHVRRSFEENEISLRIGPQFRIIRMYEVERVISSNRRQLDFSFGSTSQGGYKTIDVQDLRTTSKGIILIPYYEQPIQIEDNQFQLTILVEN